MKKRSQMKDISQEGIQENHEESLVSLPISRTV